MKVYNTLSGQKEEFLPRGDEVKLYVCGVTPYSDAHIGHAMSYVIFDVIRRYLQFGGFKVKYVQNITDIDDKIIDRAGRLGISTRELAEKYTNSYFEDMDALNISRADIYPKATEEIPKIIEVIQGLVDKGYAYPARGSVYFRVRNVPDYGKLSHRSPESTMATENAVGGEDKESPMDFVLWKATKPGEPAWESPWGQGRPGWHIECSAMSLKYLGETLDIHGGGQDLVFPHHENEIAQSESFTGIKPFVKYWLHNGLVQLGEEKMSKSLGNLITIKEALEKYGADAIRIFILGSHYRSPLTYSEEALEAAEKGADRLRQAVHGEYVAGRDEADIDVKAYRDKFIQVMDDDFNTAQALASLFDLARDINRFSDEGYSIEEAKQLLQKLACDILGLTLKEREKLQIPPETIPTFAKNLESTSVTNIALVNSALAGPNIISEQDTSRIQDALVKVSKTSEDIAEKMRPVSDEPSNIIKEQIPVLYNSFVANIDAQIYLRTQLREAKQFQLTDEIRAKLGELGIALEDTPKGTVWKRKREPDASGESKRGEASLT